MVHRRADKNKAVNKGSSERTNKSAKYWVNYKKRTGSEGKSSEEGAKRAVIRFKKEHLSKADESTNIWLTGATFKVTSNSESFLKSLPRQFGSFERGNVQKSVVYKTCK